jgi:hypothetical protein
MSAARRKLNKHQYLGTTLDLSKCISIMLQNGLTLSLITYRHGKLSITCQSRGGNVPGSKLALDIKLKSDLINNRVGCHSV